MTFLKRLMSLLCAAVLAATPLAAAERAIIILDGSGSMWAQIDGKARITIARETLQSVIGTLPGDLELGFMTYGHRTKGDCNDIELLVPPAAGTGPAILAAAEAINPKGKTPLSAAVRQAAEELRYTEDKATVILITDGLETCEADPCALASSLESSGIDFTTHVLGFGLTDEEGQQVACLAENTGGKYLQASDAQALTDALTATVAEVAEAQPTPTPEPEPQPTPAAAVEFNFIPEVVMAEGGDPLTDADIVWSFLTPNADGSAGEWISTEYSAGIKANITPGDYILRAELGYARVDQPITITADEVARPYVVLNAGTLNIRPIPTAGADVDRNGTVHFKFPGGDTTSYGESTLVVPAGEQTVTVTIGKGELVETFALAAGEVMTRDMVVGVGRAAINAFYDEDLKVEDGDLFLQIVAAKKAIDGSRKDITYGYGPDQGFDLPPGDYVVVATMKDAETEMPFTVTDGELTEVSVILDAGVLAITAPLAGNIQVFSAAKNIQGEREQVSYGFDGAMQTTLPAGDYVIVTEYDADIADKETPATVVAGERTEVTVE